MRSKFYFLCVLGMLLLLAANANAQVKAGSFSVSPIFGYSMFSHDAIFEDDVTYGVSVGYNFSENFGIEASYNTFDTKVIPEGVSVGGWTEPFPPPPGVDTEPTVIVPGGIDVTGDQYRLEGLFYIYPGKKFAPYAALGIGQIEYEYNGESVSKTNVPAGFGFKYFVTDMIAIRADFRDCVKLPESNLIISAGVTFQFGGN